MVVSFQNIQWSCLGNILLWNLTVSIVEVLGVIVA